jgi:hypothetical protein
MPRPKELSPEIAKINTAISKAAWRQRNREQWLQSMKDAYRKRQDKKKAEQKD